MRSAMPFSSVTQDKNFFFRWTLGRKISALAMLMLALLGGTSTHFYFEIYEISREVEEMAQSDFPLYEITNRIILLDQQRQLYIQQIIEREASRAEKNTENFNATFYKLEKLQAEIDRNILRGYEKATFSISEELKKEDEFRLNEDKEDYAKLRDIFLSLQRKNSEFRTVLNSLRLMNRRDKIGVDQDILIKAEKVLDDFEDVAEKILARLRGHIQGSATATIYERESALQNNGVIVLITILFGLICSAWMIKQITSSLKKVTNQAKFITDNIQDRSELNQSLKIETNDEIRDLAVAFNQMVDNFLSIQAEREQISEQILHQKEIAQWQANHDELTGLSNRRDFEDQVKRLLLKEGEEHSLLYMDLDHFKIVNDTCGHKAGDILLQEITKIISSNIRDSDTFSRVGGDEFVILLHHCQLRNAMVVADKILNSIQKFIFLWDKRSFKVGISIGLISFQAQKDRFESILNAADTACYEAKNRGRNQIYVMHNKDHELALQSEEMDCLSDIYQALDHDKFVLYYQTIRPLQRQDSRGEHYEVLLRMEDKNGEIISPGVFLPIAERYHLMNQIDRWVIHTLFESQAHHYSHQSYRQQQEQGLLSLYTINLSGETVNDITFVDFVLKELEHYQIQPELICFEVTETVAIANLNQAQRMMQQLQAIGCRFALDDFGSGMSSFGYLKNLPVNFLKIDGLFMRELLSDPINQTIIKSFHQVAQDMGIATIAEFVDSQEKMDCLINLGIDYAQGYWIAKPTPLKAAALAELSL